MTFNRIPNRGLAAALCLLALGAIGCDTQGCTTIGCGPSQFRLVKDAWAPGEYELEVSYSQGGDVSFLCTFQVSDAVDVDDAGAGATEPPCVQLTGPIRAVDVLVNDSGPTLQVFGSPTTLQLTLRGMDQTLFEDTLTPDYTDSFPNGPDCGSCQTASTSVDIP